MAWKIGAGAALLALVLSAGCGDDDVTDVLADAAITVPDADPAAEGVQMVSCAEVTVAEDVAIGSGTFEPLEISVGPGDVIRWTNTDQVPHAVTSGDPEDADVGRLFDSGDLAPQDEVCLRFQEAGAFAYHCRIHPTTHRDASVMVH